MLFIYGNSSILSMMKMRTMAMTTIIMIIMTMMMMMMMIEDKACKCEADIGTQESECSLNPTETQIKMRRIKKYFLETIEILLVVVRTMVMKIILNFQLLLIWN